MLEPESVIGLPYSFRAAVRQIVFIFVDDVVGYIENKMDAI
ncbi:hypothetical protein [Leyella lascolaii]|uniref:Uncharacterized protein n=1 Tax=Leyella lascolaii TaxID=1776379 RepID=A0AAW7JQ95_9BACT|nr:hypothetical protein [Leyella lascolaii]MDN0023185.1 hypothetical protein [Leyella lascolaii]MDN0025060.1 hypothetical protein [Leyella lascolaii]